MEWLQDYLSWKIKFSNNKKRAWLGQPHLIKKFENKFGGLVNEIRSHKTPGTSKFLIVKPTEEIKKILIKDQQKYWSDIGMLFYLVKHLRPDLANATRELSNANDGENPVAYKRLLCMIKYVINTKNLGLRIKPMGNSDEPWEIVCFSIIDYHGDPMNRQHISGFIVYVLGEPVSWQSKLQKSVSLSSS